MHILVSTLRRSYAAIIVAETIGKRGKTQTFEIAIDNNQIAGYGFYKDGKLVRAVFIDSQAFSKENGETRHSIHLEFDVTGPDGSTDMTVKRLAIGHAGRYFRIDMRWTELRDRRWSCR
ncbi:hypothetical protein PM082_018126 [Marasmius tenuissimus]|nr:hypothetical protein PM082_018126 [Marasmius tenuissimus]